MSLDKLANYYDDSVCIVCDSFEEKCELMDFCNEYRDKVYRQGIGWNDGYYDPIYSEYRYVKLKIVNRQIISSSHSNTIIPAIDTISFQEMCDKFFPNHQRKTINRYELF